MNASQHKRALKELRGSDRIARVEAAKKLSLDSTVFPALRELLRVEQLVETRHAIAYALSWQEDARTWAVLLRLLTDANEHPTVRAQAAEGLAYKFHRKRRGSLGFQAALDTLCSAASDPSPELRYYAAFALGESGEPKVLSVLRKLTKDRARAPSFVGCVGDEARAAIKRLTAPSSP